MCPNLLFFFGKHGPAFITEQWHLQTEALSTDVVYVVLKWHWFNVDLLDKYTLKPEQGKSADACVKCVVGCVLWESVTIKTNARYGQGKNLPLVLWLVNKSRPLNQYSSYTQCKAHITAHITKENLLLWEKTSLHWNSNKIPEWLAISKQFYDVKKRVLMIFCWY